jgi:7,8-dihydroneopterin aldolase/epimerase/oxygenase
VSDQIALMNMKFQGKHGVPAAERAAAQPFEVDAVLFLDLRPAGLADDIDKTADYSDILEICREVVEGTSLKLIESMAELIATGLLSRFSAAGVTEVMVRVRKPKVPLPGELDGAAVEIRRHAAEGGS